MYQAATEGESYCFIFLPPLSKLCTARLKANSVWRSCHTWCYDLHTHTHTLPLMPLPCHLFKYFYLYISIFKQFHLMTLVILPIPIHSMKYNQINDDLFLKVDCFLDFLPARPISCFLQRGAGYLEIQCRTLSGCIYIEIRTGAELPGCLFRGIKSDFMSHCEESYNCFCFPRIQKQD